jgi:hypothetical protein
LNDQWVAASIALKHINMVMLVEEKPHLHDNENSCMPL